MREFFIVLGVLAVTALLTVFTVENMIKGPNTQPETTANTDTANVPATSTIPATSEDVPTPGLSSETITQTSTSTTDPKQGETVSTRTVNEFRLVLSSAPYTINGQTFDAEIGTIEVQEIRGQENSRKIELPVIRIFSTNPNAQVPVFLLADGPGKSNLWQANTPTWLLDQHDLIIVGYRGVDGSVSLDLPEVEQALESMQVDPLSPVGLDQMGNAIRQGFNRLRQSGIAVDNYTITDVVGDMDNVRQALSFNQIHFFAAGYGTRVAYAYGVNYPQFVQRSLMAGMNPPGGLITDPMHLDEVFQEYAQLWQQTGRGTNLLQTIRTALGQLPQTWKGLRIDADKVRMGTLLQLAKVTNAPRVFDAYVQASRGDIAGLAWLASFYDQYVRDINWGDFYAKGGSADAELNRNYTAELAAPGSVFGSPLSQLQWGGYQRGGVNLSPIDFSNRTPQTTFVNTLMVHGSLDPLTPVHEAESMLPYLSNGRLVILNGMGHTDDLMHLQSGAFQQLVKSYFSNGSVDQSRFVLQRISFN